MAQNQEFEASFQEALKLFQQKSYREGIDRLLDIRAKGFVSANLENNLGRAFCEGGQIGQCVEHLTYAVALNRFDANYRRDLQTAQARVDSGFGQPSTHPSETANTISSYLRPEESFSVASLLILTLIALKLLKNISKRIQFSLASIILLICALSIFSLMGSSIAVVTKDAELRLNPLESADSVQTLKSGTRLQILKVSGNFVEVERTNAFRGWIKNDTIVKSPY